MTALPVTKLNFGGLTFDIQSAAFRLGNLLCFGRAESDSAGSCSDLKLAGVMRSGLYNVKRPGEQFYRVVKCEMELGGYEDVPEEDEQDPGQAEREDLEFRVDSLENPPIVSVCGSQKRFSGDFTVVNYDYLLHNATNLAGGPALDIGSGVFTAPLAGVYSVSWALSADNAHGEPSVSIYLRHNEVNLEETRHYSSYSGSSGWVGEQGGRSLVLELAAADTVNLYCDNCSAAIDRTTFCITLLQAL